MKGSLSLQEVLLGGGHLGTPADPRYNLPEQKRVKFALTTLTRMTHPGVLAIDLSEVSVEMVGLDVDLSKHGAALANENLVVQVLRGVCTHFTTSSIFCNMLNVDSSGQNLRTLSYLEGDVCAASHERASHLLT